MCLLQRLVEARDLLVAVLLLSSDSFPFFDLVGVGPVIAVLVSTNCPAVGPAMGVRLRPFLLLLGATTKALAVVAGAVDCPRGHSDRRLGLMALLVPAVGLTMMRTESGPPVAPLGRVAAIAGTAFLSLCSTLGEPAKGANRLLCRRRPRRTGAAAGDYCSVMWCL